MPVDFNAAQSLINARGIQPPQGIQPGSPQYQEWAVSYLQNAVNAGDPQAMQIAGQNTGTGWQGDYNSGSYGSGQGSNWVGQRAPTPDELRQHSWNMGWGTDDYGDIPNSVLQQWINNAWDVNRGGFFTRSGKRVDKPTDSFGKGANADWVEGFAPGQKWSNYTAAMGRSMAGMGGGGQPTGPNAAASGGYNPVDPLQQKLMGMVSGGAGFFGENPYNNAASLKGGGVWWGQGGDFSQAFNPLKPKGGGGGGGFGGGGKGEYMQKAQGNPFTQVAAQTNANIGTSQANPQATSMQTGFNPNLPDYKKVLSKKLAEYYK